MDARAHRTGLIVRPWASTLIQQGDQMNAKRNAGFIAVGALALAAAGSAIGQADNTNSRMAPTGTFSTWMTEQSRMNNGYITREEYMNEAGRRWDMADKNRRGLTPAEVNQIYGYGSSAAAATRTQDKSEGRMSPAVPGPTK
jgi:hypothetical protein